MNKKIYIVIPTKSREKTLVFSIKTALSQDYDNFQVIVSDNYSDANVRSIVSQFNDDRLIYQRSNKPLCMRDSWEFALSGVSGSGLVHFMGDDNGLVPGALRRVNEIHQLTGAKVIHSEVVDYIWPDTLTERCGLYVPLSKDYYKISSKRALNGAFNLFFGFSKLPTINVAFVDTAVIEKAKEYGRGRYFLASNPDVYSAFINTFVEDSYIYSHYPFIVNGASSARTGASSQKNAVTSTFIEDNLRDNYSYHELFPPSTSYYLNVYEALAVMCDATNYRDFRKDFNFGKLLAKMIKDEYIFRDRFWLKDNISNYASTHGLKFNPEYRGRTKLSINASQLSPKFTINNKLNLENFPEIMPDVYAASILAGCILSDAIKNDNVSRCISYLKQKLLKLLLKY